MRFRRRQDSDFHSEIESHIRLETDRLIAEGMPAADAHAAARRAFGNTGRAREEFYESGRWMGWDECVRDLRYGFRSLAKTPSFTVAAGLTVALAIGANTAMYSLVDAVLLRSLPVHDPSGLVFVRASGRAGAESSLPFRAFSRLRAESRAFRGMAAFATDELRIELDGRPEPVNSQIASGDYFTLLGVKASLGHLMDINDETSNAAVAVISDRYWRRRFGADPAVLGTTFVNGERAYTIVGVTSPGFEGLQPGFAVDVTIPISPNLQDSLTGHNIVARLKPDLPDTQARSEATGVLRAILTELGYPPAQIAELYGQVELLPAGHGLHTLRGRFARPLYALMGIAVLVLLLAAANIVNLLLARGLTRRREFAIRLAAGAGRLRLLRQLVTETLMLFVCGAIPGILLARVGVNLIQAMFAEGRRTITIQADLNWRVLAFTATVTLGAGLIAALFPAWRVLRSDLEQVIREGQSRSSESRSSSTLRQTLIGFQVAVSLVLLVAAVTFAGTLANLYDIDPGFNNDRVLTMSVELPQGYVQTGKSATLWNDVLAAVQELPGVKSASLASFTPLSGRDRLAPVSVRGHIPSSANDSLVHFDHISEGFFETLGVPLLRGRLFTLMDSEGHPKVAIINEAAAKRFFGRRDPIGERLTVDKVDCRIVGMVRDTKHNSLRQPSVPFAFVPLRQALYPERRVTLSAASVADGADSAALLEPIRRRLSQVHSGLMIYEVISMRRQTEATLLTERLLSGLASAFGALAMILASVGLYGVLSYRVGQQRQSIAIRMALGASPTSVASAVMRQSGFILGAGILCGLPFAVLAARAADSLLWGVRPNDPAIYLSVAGMLCLVGLVSSWLPARRASSIQPATALRQD